MGLHHVTTLPSSLVDHLATIPDPRRQRGRSYEWLFLLTLLVAAMLTGVLMSVLLALFSIKYLVDQVVLGVVLNLLASGLTGFLFDQLVQPNSATLNRSPIMEPIRIPLLADIPFFGPIFFSQTILA